MICVMNHEAMQAMGSPEWAELGRLADRRAELVEHVAALEGDQRAANQAATAAATAIADAERVRLAGGDVSDTKRLESALARARGRASEPWPERLAGARRAVADQDRRIQEFIGAHYDELQAALREQGERAARRVDAAAAEIVAADAAWQALASQMSALASQLGRLRPGDHVHSRAEAVVREAARLLDVGGELAPDVRDPRLPRYAATADADALATT
jgi:hypothetical protein